MQSLNRNHANANTLAEALKTARWPKQKMQAPEEMGPHKINGIPKLASSVASMKDG